MTIGWPVRAQYYPDKLTLVAINAVNGSRKQERSSAASHRTSFPFTREIFYETWSHLRRG